MFRIGGIRGGPALLYCNRRQRLAKIVTGVSATVLIVSILTLFVPEMLTLQQECSSLRLNHWEKSVQSISVCLYLAATTYFATIASRRWLSDDEVVLNLRILVAGFLVVLALNAATALLIIEVGNVQETCDSLMIATYISYAIMTLNSVLLSAVTMALLVAIATEVFQQQQILNSVL